MRQTRRGQEGTGSFGSEPGFPAKKTALEPICQGRETRSSVSKPVPGEGTSPQKKAMGGRKSIPQNEWERKDGGNLAIISSRHPLLVLLRPYPHDLGGLGVEGEDEACIANARPRFIHRKNLKFRE